MISCVKTNPNTRNCKHSAILWKSKHYFNPVYDISTFKSSLNSILHAERSTRVFQRRNKLRHTQIAIIRRFCRLIKRYFPPVWDISKFKRSFSLHYRRGTWFTRFPASRRDQTHANHNHSSISLKIMRYSFPVWDISTFKRSFHSILHSERSACVFHRRIKPRHP